MVSFELSANMYDFALKPRMLCSLISEQLLSEKHPLRCPSAVPDVISVIRIHGLLAESFPQSNNSKILQSWKSAVDEWVDRILSLVSSDTPDKCWVGVALLGVTCQECSDDRFLSSYTDWFNKLLSHLQMPVVSHVVKVASLAAVSDLFTRLCSFPNTMKEGDLLGGKIIRLCVNFLNDDHSEAISDRVACLLCTLVTIFPSSVRRHYDNLQDIIVSKILSGKCSFHLLENFAQCLALLPKSRDENSWSFLMRRILLLLHTYFSTALQGLEEGKKFDEIHRLIVPPGHDPLPPLGGDFNFFEVQVKKMEISGPLPLHSVSSLVLCCCIMLTSTYPFQVNIPIRSLLALVKFMLAVDGSMSQALLPLTTHVQQEIICSQLPVFHSYSLDLLSATINASHSQLLPHSADIVHLLVHFINICKLPELRIKIYSILKILLTSMGAGIALNLAHDVTRNAFLDLESFCSENSGASLKAPPTKTLAKPRRRKRKHLTSRGPVEEQSLGVVSNNYTSSIYLMIAALEAVESLLTVGGSLRSEAWRAKIDLLAITVATKACKGGWEKEEKSVFIPNEPIATWESFQLASLRCLLASLLSPARVRPLYLAQGLALFRRGKQEVGTKVADFCRLSLLALEVVIHPRALPFFHSSSSSPDPHTLQPVQESDSEDVDELYTRWHSDEPFNDDEPLNDAAAIEEPSRTFSEPSRTSPEPSRPFSDPSLEPALKEDRIVHDDGMVGEPENNVVAGIEEDSRSFSDHRFEPPLVEDSIVREPGNNAAVAMEEGSRTFPEPRFEAGFKEQSRVEMKEKFETEAVNGKMALEGLDARLERNVEGLNMEIGNGFVSDGSDGSMPEMVFYSDSGEDHE